MISIRRLIASMLAGALLVLVSAAQASAQGDGGLGLALEGVGRGLSAASEVIGEGDVIVVDESLVAAMGVYDAWMAKHGDSDMPGVRQGPMNAQAVHEALLNGDVPGQLEKDTGSKLSELSGMYEGLKGKSEAAKEAKDKSNSGKSEGKSNNGKSQSDKAKSESATPSENANNGQGQQNRP